MWEFKAVTVPVNTVGGAEKNDQALTDALAPLAAEGYDLVSVTPLLGAAPSYEARPSDAAANIVTRGLTLILKREVRSKPPIPVVAPSGATTGSALR